MANQNAKNWGTMGLGLLLTLALVTGCSSNVGVGTTGVDQTLTNTQTDNTAPAEVAPIRARTSYTLVACDSLGDSIFGSEKPVTERLAKND